MSSKFEGRNHPSIFNDVIGPVMRGPSSSHCAAAVRIGRLARDLIGGQMDRVLVEFHPDGSLATTHTTQGSDMGLFGGLLGWEATDDRLTQSEHAIREAGINVDIRITDFDARHPNTYKLTLEHGTERREMTAISTGGGMIEVLQIDGFPVSVLGDYYETLIYLDSGGEQLVQSLAGSLDADHVLLRTGRGRELVQVQAQAFVPDDVLVEVLAGHGVRRITRLAPVLPVLSRREAQVPFITCQEMLAYNAPRGLELWELAVHYERARANLAPDQVIEKMAGVVDVMQDAVHNGIAGTEYGDRILGAQSGHFLEHLENGRLLDGGVLNRMMLYVTAIMETKSSMGVIVAAPTAGACGGLPGAVIGAASDMGMSQDDVVKGMLAAGVVGVFIAAHATFAAEVGGCQAECGAGSGMAAAALVTLAGGTAQQAVDAASMALQNVLGMICDPVANRVEVPCLGKNVMAAANALACANMALAGYDAVIPLDEVIDTMDKVGPSLPVELRCTALGGLSITPASREIEKRLNQGSAKKQ